MEHAASDLRMKAGSTLFFDRGNVTKLVCADHTVEPLSSRSASRPFGKSEVFLKRISGEVFGSVTNSPPVPVVGSGRVEKKKLNES